MHRIGKPQKFKIRNSGTIPCKLTVSKIDAVSPQRVRNPLRSSQKDGKCAKSFSKIDMSSNGTAQNSRKQRLLRKRSSKRSMRPNSQRRALKTKSAIKVSINYENTDLNLGPSENRI